MRTRIVALAILAVSTGCTVGSGDPINPVPGSGTSVVDEKYPTENIGSSVGKVIRNYLFNGYVNASKAAGEAARTEMTLGLFYNPTGNGIFDAEGPFEEGDPLPKALVINVGAVWCGPCKQEAAEVLPVEYEALEPQGLELLFVLFDSNSPGVAATFADLDNWTQTFDVQYPAVLDPGRQMADIGDPSQFPFNLIIDPKTMQIVEFVTGIPPDTFWAKVHELLAAE